MGGQKIRKVQKSGLEETCVGNVAATLHLISRLYTNQYNNIITHTTHLSPHLSFFSLFLWKFLSPEKRAKKIKMALQIPTKSIPLPSFLTPTGNAGLRRPSDAFALKSSFFSPSVHLLLPARPRYAARATAPKISMRLASKQAYICRDCGYFLHQFLFFLFFFIFLRNFDLIFYFLWCRYIYNDRTPFEKLPDGYFCPGIIQIEIFW